MALAKSIDAGASSAARVEKDRAMTFLATLTSQIREYLHTGATNRLLTTMPDASDTNYNCDEQSADVFKPENKYFVCLPMLDIIDLMTAQHVDVTKGVLAYIKDRAHGASRGGMPRCGERCPIIVQFQRELAHTLGLEVGLYKYVNLVTRISFWESCSPDFATQIIQNMEVRVYLPDDVVRKGETGDEMFMPNRGICELSDPADSQKPNVAILASGRDNTSGRSDLASPPVIDDVSDSSDDNEEGDSSEAEQKQDHQQRKKWLFRRGLVGGNPKKMVYPVKNNYEMNSAQRLQTEKKQVLLFPGQAFGEMSLLMNYKRTANIRAVTYVEICIFNRASFQRIISRYPEDRRQVLAVMLRNCIEKKEIPFPWDEVVDAVAERRRRIGGLGAARLGLQPSMKTCRSQRRPRSRTTGRVANPACDACRFEVVPAQAAKAVSTRV
jgi:CRP-like cAMP-binding protein